eukprot:TRINITY_DN8542_c0_g1_i1.p1 TRINITY_DN8542_c0_g1~~TRINITY_DN8542_c0_g1_i1.p1  ORF type:complete len:165 (-),score=16.66 TRINITY_DN8542_c0_g1_i1:194-688(-)
MGARAWTLAAENEDEMNEWIDALMEVINQARNHEYRRDNIRRSKGSLVPKSPFKSPPSSNNAPNLTPLAEADSSLGGAHMPSRLFLRAPNSNSSSTPDGTSISLGGGILSSDGSSSVLLDDIDFRDEEKSSGDVVFIDGSKGKYLEKQLTPEEMIRTGKFVTSY